MAFYSETHINELPGNLLCEKQNNSDFTELTGITKDCLSCSKMRGELK